MNLLVLVEGSSVEPSVYPAWIKWINPSLNQVFSLDALDGDKYFIFSGNGYPQYLEAIDSAVDDLNSLPAIDRLVVAIDSEEMSYFDKRTEIENQIIARNPQKQWRVIVQHFCFETWALANKKIGPRNPASPRLRRYRNIFDVLIHDPELLPNLLADNLNRSQFAFKYFKECMKEKGVHFSKAKASYIANARFVTQIERRRAEVGHVASFGDFKSAFV